MYIENEWHIINNSHSRMFWTLLHQEMPEKNVLHKLLIVYLHLLLLFILILLIAQMSMYLKLI